MTGTSETPAEGKSTTPLSPDDLPIPPRELATRIGGAFEDYRSIGWMHRAYLESMLPSDWSFANKTVLDFGCGTGRTLSAFAAESRVSRFVGCDIHEPSVAWATETLSPPFEFFVCREEPPLAQPEARFDLVYAFSVFTHITDQWSEWVAELHRVMRPGGTAVISVLGPAMALQILGRGWDDRIGMAVVDLHKDWSIGGPSVLLSEWWIREHWGRAFEITGFQPCDPAAGSGHDLVLMRRRDVPVTPDDLVRRDPTDAREQAAVDCNLELVLDQQKALGDQLRAGNVGSPPNQLDPTRTEPDETGVVGALRRAGTAARARLPR
jgi:SAM-dependent methyltransferase